MQMSSLDMNGANQSTFTSGQKHFDTEAIFSNYH